MQSALKPHAFESRRHVVNWNDEWGDRDLWRSASEFFELASADDVTANQVVEGVQNIIKRDASQTGLHVLGYVLATATATATQAFHLQLAAYETMLMWYSPKDFVNRLILLPYFESYWQHAASNFRFEFRMPNLTIPSIQEALKASEPDRIRAILSAASGAFHISGSDEALRRLNQLKPDAK